MGAANSKYTPYADYKKPFKEKDEELLKKINGIASKIIVETSSKEILKFLEPNYCNSIIHILEKVLNVNFTENKIKAIHSLIKNHKIVEQNILDLNKIEIGREELTKTKKSICYEVAVYYVKFSHLYSAIYHVINPILNKKVISIENMNFCARRDMKDNIKENISKDKTNINVTVSNHFCNINKKTTINENGEKSKTYLKKLGEEAGIKELDDLYKDEYDPVKKKFVMSSESKKEYKNELSKIYKAFTGKTLPDDIQSFKDIPLYSYEKNKMCTTKELDFKTGYMGTLSPGENDLLRYIKHIKRIMQINYENNEKFIKILDEMFKKNEDNNEIAINEEFTMDVLDEKIKEVRKFIVSMYIDCEKNFKTGIKLFKKIVLNSKLKKIIKMESVKEEKPKNYYDYFRRRQNVENIKNNEYIRDVKDKKTTSFARDNDDAVNEIINDVDAIINADYKVLPYFGLTLLTDFYQEIKKNNENRIMDITYKNYCFQLISQLIYILLYNDIKYLIMDKNNKYYSLFVNIFRSVFSNIIGSETMNTNDTQENIDHVYSGIHFQICCDGLCAAEKKECFNCETFDCFINGERWSDEKSNLDLCGECYNNFEKLKELDDFKYLNKESFERKEVSETFNGPGCEDINVNIEKDFKYLESNGKKFRNQWTNNNEKKNWDFLKENSNFRIIKDISLSNGKIIKGEGIDAFENNIEKYEIIEFTDFISDVKVSIKIYNDDGTETIVTGKLDENIIIFPKITSQEIEFLNRFILPGN